VSEASLLSRGDRFGQLATFDFEHAMAHRKLLAVMSPLTSYSVLPYMLDPSQDVGRSASKWHLNHQQAHNDALTSVPAQYGAPVTAQAGLFVGQNLVDTDFDNERQLTWWMFENWMEHHVANASVRPGPAGGTAKKWQYPFW
jgi:hypothetical protein